MWLAAILAFLTVIALLAAIVSWRIYDRGDAVLWLCIAILLGWWSYSNYVDWNRSG